MQKPTRLEQTTLKPTRVEQTTLKPTRVEQTTLKPTRAEQKKRKPTRAKSKPTRAEQSKPKHRPHTDYQGLLRQWQDRPKAHRRPPWSWQDIPWVPGWPLWPLGLKLALARTQALKLVLEQRSWNLRPSLGPSWEQDAVLEEQAFEDVLAEWVLEGALEEQSWLRPVKMEDWKEDQVSFLGSMWNWIPWNWERHSRPWLKDWVLWDWERHSWPWFKNWIPGDWNRLSWPWLENWALWNQELHSWPWQESWILRDRERHS